MPVLLAILEILLKAEPALASLIKDWAYGQTPQAHPDPIYPQVHKLLSEAEETLNAVQAKLAGVE